jgi:hypothetical protein
MSNKRITDLTELTTPTTDDVFPIVDIATNTTQKVQVGNLPIQTAVTTALATKQATLVSGTNIKTVNSTSLVGSGNVAVQPTLVSGTNIKTLNSVSLLGSGDIVLTATPSGVSGAIQFSNGSAFASDAANFFWDDTNNRLGVGTNAPSTPISIISGNGSNDGTTGISFGPSPANFRLSNYFNIGILTAPSGPIYSISSGGFQVGNSYSNAGGVSAGMLGVRGSGSTSATTSLLVQNSAGMAAFKVADNLDITVGKDILMAVGNTIYMGNDRITSYNGNSFGFQLSGAWRARITTTGSVFGSDTINASAVLEAVSTTQGFLPPRMTTTQKNAIASPAAGLVVYDSTTNKLQCYNGSTWNDLF